MRKIVYILLLSVSVLKAQIPFYFPYQVTETSCITDSIDMGEWWIYVDNSVKVEDVAWDDGSEAVTNANRGFDGINNTGDITTTIGAGDYAAYYCDTSTTCGYSDWYLPSAVELDSIYNYKSAFDIPSSYYWTSTEVMDNEAYIVNLSSGFIESGGKEFSCDVICIRKKSGTIPCADYEIDMGTWSIYTLPYTIMTGYGWDDAAATEVGAIYDNGSRNSDSIIAEYGSGDYAAKICADLTACGYSDWYLPSLVEMDSIYANKSSIDPYFPAYFGGSAYYWTSSEVSSSNAYSVDFSDGSSSSDDKGKSINAIRCVRATGSYWYTVDTVGLTTGEWDENATYTGCDDEPSCESDFTYLRSVSGDSMQFFFQVYSSGNAVFEAQWDYDNSIIQTGDSIYIYGSYSCEKETNYSEGSIYFSTYVEDGNWIFDDGTSYNTGNVAFELKGIANTSVYFDVYFDATVGSGMSSNFTMYLYINKIIVKRQHNF